MGINFLPLSASLAIEGTPDCMRVPRDAHSWLRKQQCRASDHDRAIVASYPAESMGRGGIRQLFLDVTPLVLLGDRRTGIQRVTRAILAQLLPSPPPGYRVEPIFRSPQQGYYYTPRFVRKCLALADFTQQDGPVAVNPGDVFLGLDPDIGLGADQQALDWLLLQRQRGMKSFFMVYDLLHLLRPDWFVLETSRRFEDWLSAISRIADGFVCGSRAVADELWAWFKMRPPPGVRSLQIGCFCYGSDIEASWPSLGLTSRHGAILGALRGREVLAMVGTVEPRKGHSLALTAMEQLWAAGETLTLVICGKQGWMVDWLAQRLRSHPELGRRLFWLEHASDEELLELYAIASGLLMASEGEGFGLPLIEAASHGLAIIVRDLPVFREVAGEHAFYFSGLRPRDLADALRAWLKLYKRGEHPQSSKMPRVSWQQSVQQLLSVVLEGNAYRAWQVRIDQPSLGTGDEGRTCLPIAEEVEALAPYAQEMPPPREDLPKAALTVWLHYHRFLKHFGDPAAYAILQRLAVNSNKPNGEWILSDEGALLLAVNRMPRRARRKIASTLHGWLEYSAARAQLPPPGLQRIWHIARQLLRGHYHRYAHGFGSAFRDLRKPSQPRQQRGEN